MSTLLLLNCGIKAFTASHATCLLPSIQNWIHTLSTQFHDLYSYLKHTALTCKGIFVSLEIMLELSWAQWHVSACGHNIVYYIHCCHLSINTLLMMHRLHWTCRLGPYTEMSYYLKDSYYWFLWCLHCIFLFERLAWDLFGTGLHLFISQSDIWKQCYVYIIQYF